MKKKYSIFLLLVFTLITVTTPYTFSQKKGTAKKKRAVSREVVIDTVFVDYSLSKAPVAPFQDTLFYIYGNIGSITVEQRAQSIIQNIRNIEKDKLQNPDSLIIEIEGSTYSIAFNGKTVMGITDHQAIVLKKTKKEISKEYLDIITNAIHKERDRTSWKNITKQIVLSLLILAITIFCIKYLLVLFRKLKTYLNKKKDKTIINKITTVLDADKQIAILQFFLRIIKFLIVIIILYFGLFTFFRLFPETTWLSDTLISYILFPLKSIYRSIKDFIPDLFSIIIIIVLFRFIIKGIRVIAEKVKTGSISLSGFYPDWSMPTFNIIKVILYIFMIILVFPHLPGANSPAFQGISVFLGVLFSLGSTSVIANIVSGIVITYMRPFQIGDRIKMGEFLGNVIEKTPLVTRIKTPKNEIITIPNGNVMSAQTVNYTSSAQKYGLILYKTITVNYDIPWRKVHELLIEAGLNTPNVLSDPKPFVLQIALDDFYVEYQINIYTKEANEMANIYSNLHTNVQDIFIRENIELLSPHYRAQRDGSDVMIPKEYIRNDKFRTSPFNMQVHITKDNNHS